MDKIKYLNSIKNLNSTRAFTDELIIIHDFSDVLSCIKIYYNSS